MRIAADAARNSRDWWLDGYGRRLLAARPGKADEWLQYGHSLKELGFLGAAEQAYRTALAEQPADAEIHLQLGHLLKLDGRFEEAAAAMREAEDLGHPDTPGIAFELDLIRRAHSTVIHRDRYGGTAGSGLHVFLSAPAKLFSESSKEGLSGLGGADYSYAFAMRGFVDALEELEIEHTILQNPEFIADIRERSDAALNVHLGFYPPERIRLLKGAYNINCFAWEFERLRAPGEVTTYHAFADQATMLGLPDELWVPSSEGAEVVARAVERPVRYVPAPVLGNLPRRPRKGRPGWKEIDRLGQALKTVTWQPLALLPRMQPQMDSMAHSRRNTLRTILRMHEGEVPPAIFLTVLNVHDFRKQLRPAIEGFLQFSLEHPDAYLLIKMTTPDRGKLTIGEFLVMDQISNAGRLVPPMVSDRVWITDDFLTRDELNQLYDLASFYVCTSYAEGQNLPILEAMARGVVPVSVNHTAMRDYVRPDNSVIMASHSVPAEPRLTTRYGLYDINIAEVYPGDVITALESAVGLTDEDYAARSRASAETVRRDFGEDRFSAEIDRLVGALSRDAENSA